MNKFGQLTSKVRDLKAQKRKLYDERSSVSNRARYDELEVLIHRLTNEIYDAVADLNDFIKEETGIDAYELPDLLRSDGYVMSKNPLIPMPKHVDLG